MTHVENCTNIDKNSLTDRCKIYPNPATDRITIESPEKAVIEIYNIQGILIEKFIAKNYLTTINLRNLANGIYTIKIVTGKEINIKKLIKQ